jgi:hypothetical protein
MSALSVGPIYQGQRRTVSRMHRVMRIALIVLSGIAAACGSTRGSEAEYPPESPLEEPSPPEEPREKRHTLTELLLHRGTDIPPGDFNGRVRAAARRHLNDCTQVVDEVASQWASNNQFPIQARDKTGGLLLHAYSSNDHGFFEISYQFGTNESRLGFFFVSDEGQQLSATQFAAYNVEDAIRQLEKAMECPG